MRPYATVSPLFWTGSTGKRLREQPDAQRVAFYLMTSPHSHQSGIYYLPMMYLCHELGIAEEGAMKALAWLYQEEFCEYDETSEWIWVCGMAEWQIGAGLSPSDKRCKGMQQFLTTLPDLPFIAKFIARYANDFHLTVEISPLQGASEGASSEQIRTEQEKNRTDKRAEARRNEVLESDPESKPRGHSLATRIPEDFRLDDDLTTYATSRLPGVRVPELLENFRNYHTANGTTMKDWNAAWRTWVGNALRLGYPGAPSKFSPPEPKRSREFGK